MLVIKLLDRFDNDSSLNLRSIKFLWKGKYFSLLLVIFLENIFKSVETLNKIKIGLKINEDFKQKNLI